ncbi:MAG: barstar family protein [Phaeodactylibacter sp.]|nr:barstar family protein [Phaeodactylibacter sp.]
MNKATFMELLGKAYSFSEYYAHNLDSAEEIIEDIKAEAGKGKLPLKPFFDALLEQEPQAEREKIWSLIADHFEVEQG